MNGKIVQMTVFQDVVLLLTDTGYIYRMTLGRFGIPSKVELEIIP